MTATSPLDAARANGRFALNFSRQWLEGLLADFPADQMCAQPIDDCNHALWIMGHLAWTDDAMLTGLGDQPSALEDGWVETFGMKSTPTGDADAYPDPARVRTVMQERRAALLAWLEGLSDDELETPLDGDWASFAPNRGGLMSTLAAHETMHAGQLSMIRRAFRLPFVY